MAEILLYTESEEFKGPLMRKFKDSHDLKSQSPFTKRFKSEANISSTKSPKIRGTNSKCMCDNLHGLNINTICNACGKSPRLTGVFTVQRKKRNDVASDFSEEGTLTNENIENCSNNQRGNVQCFKSFNYGPKGLKLTQVKSKGKVYVSDHRSILIDTNEPNKTNSSQFANDILTNTKNNFNGLKSLSKNSNFNAKIKEKTGTKKNFELTKQGSSKRLTIESITIRNNNKDNPGARISSTRNTRSLVDKTNLFVNTVVQRNKASEICADKDEADCASYLKRTVSSNLKEKSKSQTKTKRLRSNLSPSSSESVFLNNIQMKTQDPNDNRQKIVRNGKLTNSNTISSNDRDNKTSNEDVTIVDLYSQYNPVESALKFDYFNKSSYANRRLVTVSRERNDTADRFTDCTSANKRRDLSKQNKDNKEVRLKREDSEVRLYNDSANDNYKLPHKLFVNNCEDGKFKAKCIPKSHKVPHMIFHSTKGLTQPHEFKFNIHKKDKIEESDGEGEIKDDEESHSICFEETAQRIPVTANASSKRAIFHINEGIGKTRAFNYISNKDSLSEDNAENPSDSCKIEIKNEIEAKEQNHFEFDIKDLISKVRDQAKKCSSKPIKSKENCEINFEDFEREVEKMINKDIQKFSNAEPKVTDSIELISNYDSFIQDNKGSARKLNFLDMSMGTIISSSISSQSNNQTVTLTSFDRADLAINGEIVFGGMLDIDEIIRQQEVFDHK